MREARENSFRFLRETWDVIFTETIPTMLNDLQIREWHKTQTAGMGLFLADIYKAIEQSLRTLIEEIEGVRLIKGESWHENLLVKSIEIGLIPDEIKSTVRGMLKYRHRLHHGYGAHLKEEFIRKYSGEAIEAFKIFTKHVTELYPETLR